jgi:hypothetical protein
MRFRPGPSRQQPGDDRTADPWPYLTPGNWTPHVTLRIGYTPNQLPHALPIVFDRLPLKGALDHSGVEDGTTGKNWPAPSSRRDGLG